MTGRTMPHDAEAEEYLLATCLIDGPDVLPRCVIAGIAADSFYDEKCRIIFEVLLEMHRSQKPTEADSLAAELKTRRQLDAVGGYPAIIQLSNRIPTTAQTSYFIEKVREQALLRDVIRTATSAVEDCYNFTGGIDEFVDSVEQRMFGVTQHRVSDRMRPAAAIVPESMRTMTQMIQRKGQLSGVRSGFKDLDQLTWGFQRSDLIILAARPSLGKTTLALNIADRAAAPRPGEQAVPVLFFSLEMTAQQLVQRMICARGRINTKLLRDGMLSKNGEETIRMAEAADELTRAPLFIDDTSAATVSYIRARARRAHARTPLGLIVVDYLQLMGATNSDAPREQQVSETSRGLKALAKELDVPILVLSQLNRSAEKDNRAPRLSDLRESGAIEQDADVVLMLSRPRDADDKFQVAADTTDLIIAKQRSGPVGDLKLTFLRDISRFENFHS